MRRVVIVGALAGVGLLIARARLPKLHERLMAMCERMLEQMPDTFPPKKAMRSIEDIRVETARILELLEARQDQADEPQLSEAAWATAAPHTA
jgi:hypothetical protein